MTLFNFGLDPVPRTTGRVEVDILKLPLRTRMGTSLTGRGNVHTLSPYNAKSQGHAEIETKSCTRLETM